MKAVPSFYEEEKTNIKPFALGSIGEKLEPFRRSPSFTVLVPILPIQFRESQRAHTKRIGGVRIISLLLHIRLCCTEGSLLLIIVFVDTCSVAVVHLFNTHLKAFLL